MEDMISDAAGSDAEEEISVQFSCKGTVASPFINEEADIEVTKDGFALASVTGATRVPWADVQALRFEDYNVHVQTRSGPYTLSRLGRDGEPCYAHMLSAYGDKVRKCLFVSGKPKVKAKGNVDTDGRAAAGVPVEFYKDCILSLPPNLSARRVPLHFVNGFEENDYTLTASVIDGTRTVYTKLGYETTPAANAVKAALKELHMKQLDQLTDLDDSLTDAQAARLAKLMPGGLAAPMGAIREAAPSFAKALETKIARSRAAETYKYFQEMSGADAVCVGFRVNDTSFGAGSGGQGELPVEMPAEMPVGALVEAFIKPGNGGGAGNGGEPGNGGDALIKPGNGGDAGSDGEPGNGGDTGSEAGPVYDGVPVYDGAPPPELPDEPPPPDPYMFLIVAPVPEGDACALEFAGGADQAAATFVYRFDRPFDDFRVKLGMALEAIAWKREIIRYTDTELAKPENKDFLMTNERNEALRFVRSCFAGRAIHRSMDSWKAQLAECLAKKD